MKNFIRDDEFFENDFNKRKNFVKKMDPGISTIEIFEMCFEYLEGKLEKYKTNGYSPFSQIIINTKRYLKWLNKQLPIEERELDNVRLKVICSTSSFGHLVNELIFRNYVEGVKTKDNEINFRATARVLQKVFILYKEDGVSEVGFEHFAKEIRNSSLSDEKMKALMLPSNK
jgi:hypothetical protein